MRILGIDPGYAIVGYGVIDYEKNKFFTVGYGAITTSAGTPLPERLEIIFDDLNAVIKKYSPDEIAIEKLFYNNNAKTAVDVCQARGVSLLAARKSLIPIFEYTPLQVKQSLVGYGRADKKQVQEMTKSFLALYDIPKPDDTADALAIAICHAHTASSLAGFLK